MDGNFLIDALMNFMNVLPCNIGGNGFNLTLGRIFPPRPEGMLGFQAVLCSFAYVFFKLRLATSTLTIANLRLAPRKRTKTWLAGKIYPWTWRCISYWTWDFPAYHVSFQGCSGAVLCFKKGGAQRGREGKLRSLEGFPKGTTLGRKWSRSPVCWTLGCPVGS